MSTNTLEDGYAPVDIAQLIAWARSAGEIGLRYQSQVESWLKNDGTLLTQVDLDIEQFLTERLLATYPGYRVISEECTANTNKASAAYTWVIDPLDGTTAYVKGLPTWGILIGLLQHHQPVWGLFYMPRLNHMTYINAEGALCSTAAENHAIKQHWDAHDFLATSMTAHTTFDMAVPRIYAPGSIGASLTYTAQGLAAAAFIPKAHLWDLVGGAALLASAGGELRYLSGKSLDYQVLYDGRLAEEPILAGHPQLLTTLQSKIKAREESALGGSDAPR